MDDLVERVRDAITLACYNRRPLEEMARAAIVECFKWRPIESAPKDATFMLMIRAGGKYEPHPFIAAWLKNQKGVFGFRDSNLLARAPTHWLPLPEPPKETEKEKQG